jgi:AraC-like DNA-binding protein
MSAMAKHPSNGAPRIHRIEAVTVEAVWGERRHETPEHELIHVRRGRARIHIARSSFEVGPGDVFVISSGTKHRDVRVSEGEYHVLYVWFTRGESLMQRIDTRRLGKLTGRARSHLKLMMTEIEDEYAQASDADDERLTLALEEILIALARYSVPSGVTKRKREGASRDAQHAKLARAGLEYVRANYAGEVALEAAARALGVSPFNLSRVFSAEHGVSFTDALTTTRMDRARELLREGELSVKQVASAVGYANGNYFAKVFRRVSGQSPSAYRASQQDA